MGIGNMMYLLATSRLARALVARASELDARYAPGFALHDHGGDMMVPLTIC